MAKVFDNRNAGALEPRNFDGDVLVATIKESSEVKTRIGTRRVVRLEEYPDAPLWCNTTQTAGIVAVLGNDDDDWKGKRIALEKVMVDNPSTGGKVEKFYPMSPAAWAEAVAEFDAAQSAASKPTTRKRGK